MKKFLKLSLLLPFYIVSCGQKEETKSPAPEAIPQEQTLKKEEAKPKDHCETERQKALSQGHIGEDVYKMAVKRNFVPIFVERDGKIVIAEWTHCSNI